MELIWRILPALLFCVAAYAVSRTMRGRMVTPLRAGKGVRLSVTVTAEKDASELEPALAGLVWLAGNAALHITVIGRALTPEGAKRTELLARKYGVLYAGGPEFGDSGWKNRRKPHR